MRSLSFASICVVAGVTLTACTSEPYKEPVVTFAQAVNKSDEALAVLDSQLTEAHAAVQRARALSGRYRVELKKCDHSIENSGKCLLLLQETDDEGRDIGAPSKLQPDAKLTQVRALLGDIKSYADNLSAILNADTSQKVANAVTKALGSVEKLATSESLKGSSSDRKAPIKDFATPTAAAVNWMVGKYVEVVKINALREATREADPIVYAATRVMTAVEEQGKRVMYTNLVKALSARMDAWRESPSEANLDKLFSAVEAVQRFSARMRSSLFTALASAHRSLTDRLADSGNIGWATTMAKVSEFRSEAETLLGVIEGLTALTESE